MDKSTNQNVSLDDDEFQVRQPGLDQRIRIVTPGKAVISTAEPESYVLLDGETASGNFSFLFRNTVFRVAADPGEGADDPTNISFRLNGNVWKGTIDDRRSLLRKQFSSQTGQASGEVTIKAPMPGLVSKILVKAGESVKRGDGLLILEAMKMENEVRAEQDGSVVRIDCAEGKPVDKNTKLLTIHYKHEQTAS